MVQQPNGRCIYERRAFSACTSGNARWPRGAALPELQGHGTEESRSRLPRRSLAREDPLPLVGIAIRRGRVGRCGGQSNHTRRTANRAFADSQTTCEMVLSPPDFSFGCHDFPRSRGLHCFRRGQYAACLDPSLENLCFPGSGGLPRSCLRGLASQSSYLSGRVCALELPLPVSAVRSGEPARAGTE